MKSLVTCTIALAALIAPAAAQAADPNCADTPHAGEPTLEWDVSDPAGGRQFAQLRFTGADGGLELSPIWVAKTARGHRVSGAWPYSQTQVRSLRLHRHRRYLLEATYTENRSHYSNYEDVQAGAPTFVRDVCVRHLARRVTIR